MLAICGQVRSAVPGRGAFQDLDLSAAFSDVAAANELVDAASRPIVIVGAGARADMTDIVAFADALDAPVLTTFKAKGQLSDAHPLAAGVVGRSGTPIASWFMNECDLIVAFGASFSNHTGIAPYKPRIQVDRDPMALGRFHSVDVAVLGDVGVTARALCDQVNSNANRANQRAELAERWALWRAEKVSRATEASRDGGFGQYMSELTTAVRYEMNITHVLLNNSTRSGTRR